MSNIVIPLTVLSVNQIPVTSRTQLFVSERMFDIRANLNPEGSGLTSTSLELPDETQFVYKHEIASNLSDVYTVDETLEEILSLINPEEIPN